MIPIANIHNIPSLGPEFKFTTDVQRVIEEVLKIPFGGDNPQKNLALIFSLIDLTSLEGSDTSQKIELLCAKVLELQKQIDFTNVAAICVYPTFALKVNQMLAGTGIKIACVAGGFPSGQLALKFKLQEVEWAIKQGATEIDVVISRGKLIEGHYQAVFDELVAIKRCCGDTHLKVIIESGELGSAKNIRIASDLAMYAGADFIKTSTGKISVGATYSAVYVMLEAIRDFHRATNIKIGLKPAGGISNVETANNYLTLVEHVVGNTWLNPELVRFGTSSLANAVLNELSKKSQLPNIYNYFKN